MIYKTIYYLEKRIENCVSVSGKSLSIFRILICLYVLTFKGFNYSWISKQSDTLFDPPVLSFVSILNGFPPSPFFEICEFILPILFLFLLFGYKTKYVSLTISAIIIICNSYYYSFGKINHGFLFELTFFLLAFSNWGNHYSLDSLKEDKKAKIKPSNNSLKILALCICFGFFSAGLPKLIGWVDFDLETSGVRAWLNRGYFLTGRDQYLASFFVDITNNFFWEIADYTAVIFEVSFLIACFTNRIIFRSYLLFAVIFHTINLLMLNIAFTNNLVAYCAFINWISFQKKIPISRKKFSKYRRILKFLFPTLTTVYVFAYFLGYKFKNIHSIFISDYISTRSLIFILANIIAFLIVCDYLIKTRKRNLTN